MLADFLHWMGLGINGTIDHITQNPNDFFEAFVVGAIVTAISIGWGLFVLLILWLCNGCKSNT